MSNLIISYLIDPVVRRARRSSGHSTTSDNPRPGNNPPTRSDGVAIREEDGPLSEITEENLEAWDRSPTLGDVVLDTISGQPVVQSPTAEYDRLDTELDSVDGESIAAASIVVDPPAQDRIDLASTSRRSTYQVDDDTSNNPRHGIPERFRSTTSSFSNSALGTAEPGVTSIEDSPHSRGNSENETTRSAAGSYSNWMGQGSLPADDGMGVMRKRILDVRQMDTSNEAKARLIHDLMTEQYNSSQSSLHAPRFGRPHSPASLVSQERPYTPNSAVSNSGGPAPATSSSTSPTDNMGDSYHLSPQDRMPTYVPKPIKATLPTSARESRVGSADQDSEFEEDQKILGCEHYRRNVKLQCSSCSRWYTCRFCHDRSEDHLLNRRETKSMLCMLCARPQPAGETCVNCGEPGARYYCGVCKLWDDDNAKSIYHCNDCGICRVGQGLGKDFFHCKTCGVCMSISIRDTHRCIERSTDCDCPICGEYMFTSPQTVVFMRCGHSIHHRCYYEHMKRAYRCPICSRSVVNMEMQFRTLERAIESQPMPPQFQDTKALISCNDCSAKTSVKYHWLGLKCAVCDSFNTAQIQILSDANTQAPAVPTSIVDRPDTDAADRLFPTTARPISRGRAMRGSTLTGRPTSAVLVAGTRRFSPYPVQPRVGRSASPLASRPLEGPSHNPSHGACEMDEVGNDAEDEDLDFWGGESRRVATGTTQPEDHHDEDDEDEDDFDDVTDDDMLDDADEEEDNDHMEIFGHR